MLMQEQLLISIRCHGQIVVLENLMVGERVCYVISALIFHQGITRDLLPVGQRRKRVYLSQGVLCCPATKVIRELAFGDKQLSTSLMTNA